MSYPANVLSQTPPESYEAKFREIHRDRQRLHTYYFFEEMTHANNPPLRAALTEIMARTNEGIEDEAEDFFAKAQMRAEQEPIHGRCDSLLVLPLLDKGLEIAKGLEKKMSPQEVKEAMQGFQLVAPTTTDPPPIKDKSKYHTNICFGFNSYNK
jgi:hypothetical protein